MCFMEDIYMLRCGEFLGNFVFWLGFIAYVSLI